MKVKLITENDEAVSAVISCNPEELLIINKALSRAYADESFGERSRNIAKQMGEDCNHFEQVEVAEQTEPQTFDKPTKCLGCLYSELDKVFHPCASCVDFSKYVGEVAVRTSHRRKG